MKRNVTNFSITAKYHCSFSFLSATNRHVIVIEIITASSLDKVPLSVSLLKHVKGKTSNEDWDPNKYYFLCCVAHTRMKLDLV